MTAIETGDKTTPSSAVFRNSSIVGLRLFMLMWTGILAWIIYGMAHQAKDGSLGQSAGWMIAAGLALFGIGATVWSCIRPRLVVIVNADGVLTREVWLWRLKRERHYAKADAFVLDLEESIDDEAVSYFKCPLRLTGTESRNRVLIVAEGYDRAKVEESRDRLLAALAA